MATLTEGWTRLFPGRDPFDAPRGRNLPWRTVALVVGLVGVSAAGGIALAGSYARPIAVYGVTGSAAAVSVLVTLALRSWWGAMSSLLIGLPLPVLWVMVLANALPGEGGGVLRGTLQALVGSGASILTSAAPTPATVDTLTLPLLATWLTGAAAALAWRAGRGALAPLPGVVLLAGAAVLNGPVAPPSFVAVGLLVASTGFLLVGSPREPDSEDGELPGFSVRVRVLRRGGSSVGRLVATAVVVVSMALATVVVAPILLSAWDSQPTDPREALAPQMDPQETLNPLSYLSAWAAEPNQHLMSVQASEDVTLRWVTLGEFTTTWLTDEGYRVADQTLPEPVPPPPHAETTSVEIAVGDALPGPWAPVVGAPRTVGVPSPGYDPMSGTVVTRAGGIAGTEYAVTGDVPEWRPDELEGATTPVEEVYDRYRHLPAGTPSVVNDVVADLASGDTSPYQRANALAEYLRESHTFNPETAGGHGYASLAAVLAPPGEEGGGGTSEQFASAFAVLARAAGLPSRVAVGFDGAADADAAAADERRVVTGDAVAWGEVYFDGVGWVPFSVTPGAYDTETAEDPASASAPDEPDAAEDDPAEEETHDLSAPVSETDSRSVPRSWLILGGLAGLLLAGLLAIPLSRRIRQERRLRSGPVTSRVLGAWHELHDTLRQCGVQPTRGDTVLDVVGAARRVAGGPDADPTTATDLLSLERAVNVVSFGPEAGSVEAEIGAVVDGTRRQLRVLRRTRGRVRRLLWWFDPRPLLWRHVRTRPRGSST
ncbi:transglutaminase domain-containing protein [Spiractinospora alimapuensis]|uniref:DUF3488 and transglutaminase-like domain-containing protein n=1 Tax=Spiractinospora alimapuensis TaxID=2820884 RepID=UPI001F387308|nr:transglutaminase domain-containing protein [Spiractinospora alimapuensis]QVQ53880.1 transglutaminase domain-containing protein [Spiractinospora alimapuensis]